MDVRKNGKTFDSGDATIFIDGIPFPEVAEITYSTNQEHQVNYSLANKATSWSRGKVEHTGTIKIYMSGVVALERKAPGRILANLKPFDINVTYVNEDNIIVNDKITCKFKGQGREVSGEMGLAQSFELLILDIKYQNI